MVKRRAAFKIGESTVAAGERTTIDLPVSKLSDHTPITMSVHVIHGRRPGPTVFVSAAIHGDEVIGVEIVRRLLGAKALDRLAGTLLVVPIVNAFGLHNHSRYLPDRRDLNRSFPGSKRGSLAARLAHLFTTEILSRSECGIDLHSAAIHRTNLPQTRISAGNEATLEMARVFGAPVILSSNLRDGSMRSAADDLGVNVIVYEAGEGLRFDETAVRAGVAGILRVLHAKGMISTRGVAKAKVHPVACTSSRWERAPSGGLFRAFVANGAHVAAGQVLGAVSDPFGEHEDEILASNAGIVIGRAVMPIIHEGDALFHIARVPGKVDGAARVETLTSQLEDEPAFGEDEII